MSKLFKNRRFGPIFWTQFFGAFNDNVFKNAMMIMIAFKSFAIMGLKSDQMVALCGGVFILPFFLFSATAGQLSDKWPKHKLVVIVKYWEAAVMGLGSFGFLFESIGLLIASLFLMGLQSAFFGPVKYSILPELLNESELTEGNAYFEMGTFLSILLGTILGGSLIGIEGQLGAISVSIAVILVAGVGIYFAHKVPVLEGARPELKVDYGVIRPTIEIIKITREVKSVFLSVLAISWFWFFGAAMLSVFPVYVKDSLHSNESVVTLLLALFSIGVAVGSLICEKMSKERVELGLVPIGSIGISFFIFDLFMVGELPVSEGLYSVGSFLEQTGAIRVLADVFLLSVFSGIFIVPLYTFIQHRSPEDKRSRVIAGNNVLNALFMVASAIVLALAFGLGASTLDVFLGLGIANAIVAIYIYSVVPEFMLRLVCLTIARLIYRVRGHGLERLPNEGAAVLTCNHVSFVDWLIIAAIVKRPVRFVMHHSFMKNAFLRFFFNGAKVIPIAGHKECPETLNKAFDKISMALKEGEIVCIFPEGKITHDGELSPFKGGVEKIIERDPVKVYPMALKGLWGSFFSRRHNGRALSSPRALLKNFNNKVELIVGEALSKPVSASAVEEATRELLGERGQSEKAS